MITVMSHKERLFQTVLFEIILVILMTLLTMLFTHNNLGKTSVLMITISLLAMLWNFLFNHFFDKKFSEPRETRSLKIRIWHAVLFEGGLLLLTIPLVMFWLNMGLWQAFVMDIAMTVLVLIYTMIFHWIYDNIRAKYFQAA